jgi:hypothetical protein
MNVETNKFWGAVFVEYVNSDASYLCNGSKTFHDCWRSQSTKRHKIAKHAQDFLNKIGYHTNCEVGTAYLFYIENEALIDDRELRIEFLFYMLKLFPNEV